MTSRLLLKGGTIVDGRRRARPALGDVLVEAGRIVRVGGSIRAPGARALRADGLLVTPGFIDTHAHSDQTAFQAPSADGRVADGVTTEINGQCGWSLFPLTGPAEKERRDPLRKSGIEAEWTDAAGYFDALEARGTAINRAFFVGHGAVRASVMGYDARPAKRDEMRRMQALAEEALSQGAFGVSSGLGYAPACFARTGEVIAVCRPAAAARRLYATHIRSEGRHLMEAVREAIHISRSSGAPLHISHVKTHGPANWSKIDMLQRAMFGAREEGMDLTGDRYPYTASMTELAAVFPRWLLAGGKEAALDRLGNRRVRARLRNEVAQAGRLGPRWDLVRVALAPGAPEFEGLSVIEISRKLDMQPSEATCEVLVRTRMAASAISFYMCEENLRRILQWPFIFVGSDSSARNMTGPTVEGKPHPRAFGTSARFLGEYVLRRKLMSLPEGVARMTSLPAARFGLKDRGVLHPGTCADILVFDPASLRDTATYDDPYSLSHGMVHVLVNGVPVMEDGRRTRARPGRVLKADG